MYIDLQACIYGTEIGNDVWEKPVFCLSQFVQSKKPLFYQK